MRLVESYRSRRSALRCPGSIFVDNRVFNPVLIPYRTAGCRMPGMICANWSAVIPTICFFSQLALPSHHDMGLPLPNSMS